MTEHESLNEIGYSEVFKNYEFMKLMGGQFFSNFGDAILQIAILLYVYSFTGDLSLTTTVLAIQLIPWIIIGPIAGVLADSISRKGIMVFADILRATTIALIPFATRVEQIMVITFLLGVASSSFAAPRSAAIPEITGQRLFVKAVSLSQLLFQTIRIIGPLLSAGIYVIFGVYTFYVASFCYTASLIFILMTKIPSVENGEEKTSVKKVFQDLGSGFRYLFNESIIRKIIILFSIIIIGGAFSGTLIYPFIYDILKGGIGEAQAQREFGIVGAIGAAGSILGNIFFGKYEDKITRRRSLIFGTLSLGTYLTLFLLISSVVQLYIIALINGFMGGMMSLAVNAIFAETVPNNIRGRAYSATNSFIQILSVVATSASGIVAEQIGIREAIVLSGLFIIALSTLMIILTKSFRFAR